MLYEKSKINLKSLTKSQEIWRVTYHFSPFAVSITDAFFLTTQNSFYIKNLTNRIKNVNFKYR